MSNIQTVRAGLRSWLSSKVRIDSWDLDKPADLFSEYSTEDNLLTANTAIEHPVEDLQYFRENFNSVKGRGKFPYQIVFRYGEDLTYHELPLSDLEGLVQYIQGQVLRNPPCANGAIISITPEDVKATVNAIREGNNQGDWFVYCNFSFEVVFKLTAFDLPDEFKPLDPDTPINPDFNLDINTYRAKVNFDSSNPDDSTLDSSLKIK
jgi:hypothetical protein